MEKTWSSINQWQWVRSVIVSLEGWGGIFLRWQVGIAGKHGWLEGIS
tara:strand:- start:159 stop:299 length:141 start_codon:yes stop_codon:yes gene_type:complete